MAEGRLPHLRQLRDRGIQVRLHSKAPYLSPRIWNSIATGRPPREHGITNFIRKDDDGTRLMLATDRRVHALWNIASRAGLRVATVNWWNTYPPALIDGVMISDHAITDDVLQARKMMRAESIPRGAQSHPPARSNAVNPRTS